MVIVTLIKNVGKPTFIFTDFLHFILPFTFSNEKGAAKVRISDDELIRNYPLKYDDIWKKCKKEIPEFKKNNEFQQIIDSITDNLDYCYVRKFYPGKESSGSTKMYSDRAFEYIKSQYNKN